MLHLSRDCAKAEQVWHAFTLPPSILTTFHMDWNVWIMENLKQKAYFMRVFMSETMPMSKLLFIRVFMLSCFPGANLLVAILN